MGARADDGGWEDRLAFGGEDEVEAMVTRVYLAALQTARPTRSLLVAQGMPAELVDRSLEILAGRGLARLHVGGQLEVMPPDIALPARAAGLERLARSTRAAAHELAQVYYQARSETGPPDGSTVRVLQSMDELAAATAEIVSAGTVQVRCFRALTPRTRALFGAPMHSHEDPTVGAGGAVLPHLAVYDTAVLGLDNALEVLTARERAGERSRFTSNVPFAAVVVDDTAAVVDLTGFDATGHGSLLVRSRPFVKALAALADRLWELSSPLSHHTGARASDRRDRAILMLLAAGASDATIARQSGVSQRTVERRVRALMDQLGASTRFQAGVLAARRGLL